MEFHDGDTMYKDNGSRWGIKGSNEISDGLTAVYRFEHKIDTANASLTGGGRLAYAGLKGGFGTITAGQIWSASYNSVGAITDNSFAYGDSETTYRHGNVISYANSFGPASVQLDLTMEGGDLKPKDIDKTEFGLSVNLGEIGKIAVAHIDTADSASVENVAVSIQTQTVATTTSTTTLSVAVLSVQIDPVGTKGSKQTAAAVEFSFGGVTPYIGYSQKKTDGATIKDKTTFAGVRGSVGDTGFGYVFQYRDKKNADGTKPDPWILGLSKALGGGASLHLEHKDPGVKGEKNTTGVWLKVDF